MAMRKLNKTKKGKKKGEKKTKKKQRKEGGKNKNKTMKGRKKNLPMEQSLFVKYGIISKDNYKYIINPSGSTRYIIYEPSEKNIVKETYKMRREKIDRIYNAIKKSYPLYVRLTNKCFRENKRTYPSYMDGGGYGCEFITMGSPIRFINQAQFRFVKRELGTDTLGIAYKIGSDFMTTQHIHYG